MLMKECELLNELAQVHGNIGGFLWICFLHKKFAVTNSNIITQLPFVDF